MPTIRFDNLSCTTAQDVDGQDEAFLAFFVDGEYAGNIYRPLRSNSQFNPGYPGLLTYGIVDRNSYSYRGFYVDAWRGVDFLLSRAEVDSARIGVTGSSQGGGLTITTAAMRREVRAAAAGAPTIATALPAGSFSCCQHRF